MDEYDNFLDKIMTDNNKIILTMLNDSDFGRLVRYIENGKVICCINGSVVTDKDLYIAIESRYMTKKDIVGIVE